MRARVRSKNHSSIERDAHTVSHFCFFQFLRVEENTGGNSSRRSSYLDQCRLTILVPAAEAAVPLVEGDPLDETGEVLLVS
jgi:hypothetical protein